MITDVPRRSVPLRTPASRWTTPRRRRSRPALPSRRNRPQTRWSPALGGTALLGGGIAQWAGEHARKQAPTRERCSLAPRLQDARSGVLQSPTRERRSLAPRLQDAAWVVAKPRLRSGAPWHRDFKSWLFASDPWGCAETRRSPRAWKTRQDGDPGPSPPRRDAPTPAPRGRGRADRAALQRHPRTLSGMPATPGETATNVVRPIGRVRSHGAQSVGPTALRSPRHASRTGRARRHGDHTAPFDPSDRTFARSSRGVYRASATVPAHRTLATGPVIG